MIFKLKKNYLKCLKDLPELPKQNIDYTLAKKYAYYALIKKPFKIEFTDVCFEKNISANLKNNIKINNYFKFINSNDVKTISNWIKSERKDNLI